MLGAEAMGAVWYEAAARSEKCSSATRSEENAEMSSVKMDTYSFGRCTSTSRSCDGSIVKSLTLY